MHRFDRQRDGEGISSREFVAISRLRYLSCSRAGDGSQPAGESCLIDVVIDARRMARNLGGIERWIRIGFGIALILLGSFLGRSWYYLELDGLAHWMRVSDAASDRCHWVVSHMNIARGQYLCSVVLGKSQPEPKLSREIEE